MSKPAVYVLVVFMLVLPFLRAVAEVESNEESRAELAELIWNSANLVDEVSWKASTFLAQARTNVTSGLMGQDLFRIIEFSYRNSIDTAQFKAKEVFARRISELDWKSQETLLNFLSSDLGKRYRATTTFNKSLEEKQMDMARRMPRLMNRKAHVEVLAVMLEDHYFQVLEKQWEFNKRTYVYGLMASALYQNGEEISETVISQALDNLAENRSAALMQMNQLMLFNSVYDFRDFSVDEVKKLDEFLGSTAGAFFLEVSTEVFIEGITAILERILEQMIDSLDQQTSKDFRGDIKNYGLEKCLDLPEAMPFDGLHLIQWSCDKSQAQSLLIKNGRLINTATKGCFSVLKDNWSRKEKLVLVQSQCDFEDVSEFESIESKKFPSFYQLRETNYDKCITLVGSEDEDGSPVELKKCRNKKNQLFSLQSNVF